MKGKKTKQKKENFKKRKQLLLKKIIYDYSSTLDLDF